MKTVFTILYDTDLEGRHHGGDLLLKGLQAAAGRHLTLLVHLTEWDTSEVVKKLVAGTTSATTSELFCIIHCREADARPAFEKLKKMTDEAITLASHLCQNSLQIKLLLISGGESPSYFTPSGSCAEQVALAQFLRLHRTEALAPAVSEMFKLDATTDCVSVDLAPLKNAMVDYHALLSAFIHEVASRSATLRLDLRSVHANRASVDDVWASAATGDGYLKGKRGGTTLLESIARHLNDEDFRRIAESSKIGVPIHTSEKFDELLKGLDDQPATPVEQLAALEKVLSWLDSLADFLRDLREEVAG